MINITIYKIILIFIIAIISGIDSILDEFQFQRPLVTCTLIGIILGEMKRGCIIGGTLEIITLGWMNVGAAIAPDIALASIISTILIIIGGQKIGTGIALAIPIATLGQIFTIIIRTIAVSFQKAADKAIKNNNINKINLIHIVATAIHGIRVAIPTLIFIISIKNINLNYIIQHIPKNIITGLSISGGIIVVIGYAMVINMMKTKYLMPFFYAGFIIAAFTNFNLIAISALGIIISIIYIQLNPIYYIQKIEVKKKTSNELEKGKNE